MRITVLLLLAFMTIHLFAVGQEPRWCEYTAILARFALSLSVGSGAQSNFNIAQKKAEEQSVDCTHRSF